MSLAGLAFLSCSFMGLLLVSLGCGLAGRGGRALGAGAPLAAAGALFGISFWRRALPAALTDGLTMTRPPSAPGTAPLISSRLRGTSTSTMRRFSMVRFLHAHVTRHALALENASRRLALADGTRGAMRYRVAVGLHAARKIMALHGAGKALAHRGAGDIDDLARGEHVDFQLAAGRQRVAFALASSGIPGR